MKIHSLGLIIRGALVALSVFAGVLLMRADESAKTLATTKNSKDGAEMILIPTGSFLMGTTKAEIDTQFTQIGLPKDWVRHTTAEQPRHRKSLKPFFLYKYEVTNKQYKDFIDVTGHRSPPHWGGKDFPAGKGRHPVVEVSWDDAQAYCRWAGTRLPTEAEWEYSARGAGNRKEQASRVFPWGDKWDRKLSNNSSLHAGKELLSGEDWNAWYGGGQKSLFPLTYCVGSFPKGASPFGALDMGGNAWEWCAEIPSPYPDQKPDEATDKRLRARKGGSWANVALHIRSADRAPAAHDDLNLYTGFRCAKDR